MYTAGRSCGYPQFVWALALARVESCEPCSHRLVSCSEVRNQNVCATKIGQLPVMQHATHGGERAIMAKVIIYLIGIRSLASPYASWLHLFPHWSILWSMSLKHACWMCCGFPVHAYFWIRFLACLGCSLSVLYIECRTRMNFKNFNCVWKASDSYFLMDFQRKTSHRPSLTFESVECPFDGVMWISVRPPGATYFHISHTRVYSISMLLLVAFG